MSDGFPTDDATLHMLIAACKINPDTGRTHLMDFLSMGKREKSRTLLQEGEGTCMADAPVYEVEFEEGYAPFSPNEVIRTLAEELLAVREGRG
jgi:hypothetical protein